MGRFLSRFLFVVLMIVSSAGVSAEASSTLAPPTVGADRGGFSELVRQLLPAVVNISTEQTVEGDAGTPGFRFPMFPKGIFEEFFNNLEPLLIEPPKPRKVVSLGSGFIVDKSGLIVTNYHVIANAKEISVKFSDDSTAKAVVLGKDLKTDLAVLKVKTKKELPYVKLGNSDSVMVGEWVLAIGNPFGLGGSVSVGIISGRARDINIGTGSEFLQTDAAINRGHSGGPLFNAQGEVIGINTAIISPQGGGNVGVAFAIPSNNAARVIAVLSKGQKVEHGWLGIVVQNVTEEMVDSLGLKDAKGALISSISKDGPASVGGLKVGDVVLEFGGQKVNDMPQLTHLIAKTGVNEKVKIVVQREGRVLTIPVTIGKLPDDLAGDLDDSEFSDNSLGLTVGSIKHSKKSEEGGVVVLRVHHNSDAFDTGIRRGDIILGINSLLVHDIPEFKQAMADITQGSGKKSSVLLLVKKGDSPPIYVPVKLNKDA